jgi:hypothetical protein
VCVCFISELVFRIKGWWEIGCQLNYRFSQQLVSELGCGEMQSLKFGIEGSTECRGTVTDGVQSTTHMQRYCSQTEYGALYTSRGTVHGVLFTSHILRSAGWRDTPDLWGDFSSAEISSWIRSLGLLEQWWFFSQYRFAPML